eukprot:TRINITY_DN1152_c1_g1_i2.p1 TRINITY_DN1152_c1_g1~~TRINITY_DN1152_c1_g1_i2.p1  ORF type:complete len:206 (-),score=43.27 TRINITY_DN1152_c1_g1_i2:55-615(-)
MSSFVRWYEKLMKRGSTRSELRLDDNELKLETKFHAQILEYHQVETNRQRLEIAQSILSLITEFNFSVVALWETLKAMFEQPELKLQTLAFQIVNQCILSQHEEMSVLVKTEILITLESLDDNFGERINTLNNLTNQGRDIHPFEVRLGHVLAMWVDKMMNQDEETDVDLICQVITLCTNIFRYVN